MKILEIVKIKEIAREREAYWIYYYLERGVYLTQPVEKLFCRAL